MQAVESLYIDLINSVNSDINVDSVFEKMTYTEAMDRFGSDKPDIRFGMELRNLTDVARKIESNVIANSLSNGGILKGFTVKNSDSYGRRDFDRLTDLVKSQGAGGLIYISIPDDIEEPIKLEQTNGPLNKFYTQENFDSILEKTEASAGDVIFMIIGEEKIVNNSLITFKCRTIK